MKMPFVNNKPIRLIELFGGIGSQAMALSRLGVNFEHYRLVEFDKYAIASYNAIHGTNFVPTDITKIKGEDLGIVETDKFCYLMTYSFPCQDLSVAGKQKGMSKGSGTRSGLLWEVERLLNETENLPQLLLMENVPQVHCKKFIDDFNKWIRSLENLGYTNYWQDLNAKDYGVAQNRNRTFMVSFLGDYSFEFPKPFELEKTMKDYLEDEVDKKYYISNEKAQALIEKLIVKGELEAKRRVSCRMNYKRIDKVDCLEAKTLCARDYKGFGTGFDTMNGVIEQVKALDEQNMCIRNETFGTLTTDGSSPKHNNRVLIKQATKQGYIECKIGGVADLSYPDSKTRRGRVQDCGNTSPTLTAGKSDICKIESPYRIRKLTPLECWRLMGFTDDEFRAAESVNSNTQLYKQAGNSIVVDVLVAIFDNLLIHSRSAWLDELLKDMTRDKGVLRDTARTIDR